MIVFHARTIFHDPILNLFSVTCSCGWATAGYADYAEALDTFTVHLEAT